MSTGEAIILLDRGARIVFWNEGAERLFLHTADAVVGSLLEELIPEQYRERHRAGFAAAVERGETRFGSPDGPVAYLPLICGDGQIRRYAGRQVIIRDPAGGIAAVAGVFVASVTSDKFIPSLYPVAGELANGDMVTGGEPARG